MANTPTLSEMLEPYPAGTAVICYRTEDGEERRWIVGATQRDNETTLRDHLKKLKPDCTYVGGQVK